MKRAGLFLAVCVALAGCGAKDKTTDGGSAYANLFDIPVSATRTPGKLLGLWSGSKTIRDPNTSRSLVMDVRMKLEIDRITLVNRCRMDNGRFLTVGATARASVNESTNTVQILETKHDEVTENDYGCAVELPIRTVVFTVDGHTARAAQGADMPELTKVTD